MNTGVISIRYAKALYEYAKEHNAQTAVYKNMQQLKDALRQVKELPVVLKSPSLSHKEKVTLICSAVELSPVFEHFITLVVKQEREDMLLYIAYAYIGIYRRENNVVAMTVTTAVPMPDSFLDRVADILESQENVDVEIRNIVDDSIIGGFVCQANYLRYDASVRNQLSEIRKTIVKSNKKIV